MPESTVLLTLSFAVCLVGMGWLALAMEAHWGQVRGSAPRPSPARVRLLRIMGALALAASLVLCLRTDHASMASLVWAMMLAGSALTVAMLLTWRPCWLRVLSLVAG